MDGLQTDFILIFFTVNDKKFGQQVATYLSNLKSMGFILETVTSETLKGKEFIKVQTPLETAVSLAGTYRIGLSCKNPYHEPEDVTVPCFRFLDTELTTRNPSLVLASRNRESVKGQKPQKPTTAERIMTVYEALRVAKFGNQPHELDVEEMTREGVLETAYPVHDGQWQWTTTGPLNDRQLLSAYWSNFWVLWKLQPIELIRKYLGPEAGFYYAMLGLYMAFLAPAAIFGFISYLVHNVKDDPRLVQICKAESTMCPYCISPKVCNLNSLSSSCHYSRLNFIFDNDSTIPFSVVMSFWGIIFLSIWERKQSFLRVTWNIHQYLRPDIVLRPGYSQQSQEPKKPNQQQEKQKLSSSRSKQLLTKSQQAKKNSFWGNLKLAVVNIYGNIRNRVSPKPKPTKTQPTVKKSKPSSGRPKPTTETPGLATEKSVPNTEKSKPELDSGNIFSTSKKQIPEEKNEKNIQYLTDKQRFASLTYLIIGVIGVSFVEFFMLICIILCRISLAEYVASSDSEPPPEGEKINTRGNAILYTAQITAILGTILIIAYDFAIDYFAIWLTNVENPRTQREFDRSYTIKLVTFSFINNFTIPIYLALFRGINYTYPGDKKMWRFFLGINADFCDVSGCLADVWILIAMIIPIKSFFNFCKNVLFPIFYKKLMDTPRLFTNTEHSQWELDRDLTLLPRYYFTKLQKEFIIQYGYMIFFASSYPLLPLIVLILNIIELRIHAMMFIRFFQRFVPRQSCERDIWKKILYIVTTLGIFINAFILGTTLNWADRLFFKKYVNKKMEGYIDASISKFSIEDYGEEFKDMKIKECYYPGRRMGKKSAVKEDDYRIYQFSDLHYQTYCAKYLFIVILLVTVIFFGAIFRFLTSAPQYLRERKVYQEKTHPK